MSKTSKKPILLITHSDAYPRNAVSMDLRSMGHPILWRRPYLGEVLPSLPWAFDNLAGVVVYGGPQNVTEIDEFDWMPDQIAWLEAWIRGSGHFLGLCLGAQMMAHALGGRVWRYPDDHCEVGFYDVTPTDEAKQEGFLDGTSSFYQFHREGFDAPKDATCLATSEDFPNQAMRWGKRAYAIQFHPEITEAMIQRWTKTVMERAPEIYERPNAKQPAQHIQGWAEHHEAITQWRTDFLPRWLAA